MTSTGLRPFVDHPRRILELTRAWSRALDCAERARRAHRRVVLLAARGAAVALEQSVAAAYAERALHYRLKLIYPEQP